MKSLLRSIILAGALDAADAFASTLTVSNTNVTGAGSLQQALWDANTNAGPDLIHFNIPGDGPHVIAPTIAQPLPSVTNTVTIDGYTQPGSSVNTLTNGNNAVLKIQLHGASAGSVNGLRITSSSNVIRGLIITGFRNTVHGISITAGANNNVIEGNQIGLVPSGVTAGIGNGTHGIHILNASGNVIGGTNPAAANIISGNLQYGLVIEGAAAGTNRVQGNLIGLAADGSRRNNNSGGMFINGAPRNLIGGETPGARNILSGNFGSGLRIASAGAVGNIVQGNFMGTDFAGTLSRSNTVNAIYLFDAPGNMIGGTNPAARNVLSGNSQNGIRLEGVAHGNRVLGNYIGTDVTGTVPLANGSNGVLFVVSFTAGTPNTNMIGGINAGAANVIAHNGFDGILVVNGTNNSVRGNALYSNGGLGIDLGTNGVTANDLADADPGANQQQNFPILTNAILTRTNFIIQGSLNSRAGTAFQVDLYANTTCDASGHGQGRWWLGASEVVTDGSGYGVFSLTLPGGSPGTAITATATDPFGNTSEFSPCLEMTAFIPTMTFTVTNTNDSGPGSLRQALFDVNEHLSQDTINFNIPGGGVKTITPFSALPVPLDAVILDGYTLPGAVPNTLTNGNNAALKLRLDGSLAGGPGVDGLHFSNTRSNVVRGLVIIGFSGDGIEFEGGGGNVVRDVWVGLDVNDGALPAGPPRRGDVSAQGGACDGVGGNAFLFRDSEDNDCESVIAACGDQAGVVFDGPGAIGNSVVNCSAGADQSLTENHANQGSGFVCQNGAQGNTFTDCTASFNQGVAFKCDQSDDNAFIRCHAAECPGDAWELAGDDNELIGCTASNVADDACAVFAGTRNNVQFQRLCNIGDQFVYLGLGVVAGQAAPTDFSAGYPGSGSLMRVMGTATGVSGAYSFRLMLKDESAPVG